MGKRPTQTLLILASVLRQGLVTPLRGPSVCMRNLCGLLAAWRIWPRNERGCAGVHECGAVLVRGVKGLLPIVTESVQTGGVSRDGGLRP